MQINSWNSETLCKFWQFLRIAIESHDEGFLGISLEFSGCWRIFRDFSGFSRIFGIFSGNFWEFMKKYVNFDGLANSNFCCLPVGPISEASRRLLAEELTEFQPKNKWMTRAGRIRRRIRQRRISAFSIYSFISLLYVDDLIYLEYVFDYWLVRWRYLYFTGENEKCRR